MDAVECNLPKSSYSLSTDSPQNPTSALKRTLSNAGPNFHGNQVWKKPKKRARKACGHCKARKVRCNVEEYGAPCMNCRLDEVECIVPRGKCKKISVSDEPSTSSKSNTMRLPLDAPLSSYPPCKLMERQSEDLQNCLFQDLQKKNTVTDLSPNAHLSIPEALSCIYQPSQRAHCSLQSTLLPTHLASTAGMSSLPILPGYIKPLPARFGLEEVTYLSNKGALSIPDIKLRDELLKAYVEFVHPLMPLLDLYSFVGRIDGNNGSALISLLLFQSVMFAAVATVDMRHLKVAGYATRRDARRDFFNRTRLLYDLDYEAEHISLIQSLLLMTHWNETPPDQKDGHHWMGIAVSLSHKIGLHRQPNQIPSMGPAKRKLWKRIWWSTYMRDRLIALGTLRPTHIKNSNFGVPMLELDDFDLAALPDGPSCIPSDCLLMRDVEQQRRLAILCIGKAKLCICISNVLSTQYSILGKNPAVLSSESKTRTVDALTAKRQESVVKQIQICDQELLAWKKNLAAEAQYVAPKLQDVISGDKSIAVNRSFLHMIYYATLSALHRLQPRPLTGIPSRSVPSDAIDLSRKAVRLATSELTIIASTLYGLDLVRYLPTSGITVLMPVIIIHILGSKASGEATRRASWQSFYQCKQIMAKLRENCAAADHSIAFLEAAIQKAEITPPQMLDRVEESRNMSTSRQSLLDAGKRVNLMDQSGGADNLIPPPEGQICDHTDTYHPGAYPITENLSNGHKVACHRNSYLTPTAPSSDRTFSRSLHDICSLYNASDSQALSDNSLIHPAFANGAIKIAYSNTDSDNEYDSPTNLDAREELFSLTTMDWIGLDNSIRLCIDLPI